ncbi:small nuclear ribonucleoprotein sm d1, partial [Phtheirospermum japonicum]
VDVNKNTHLKIVKSQLKANIPITINHQSVRGNTMHYYILCDNLVLNLYLSRKLRELSTRSHLHGHFRIMVRE